MGLLRNTQLPDTLAWERVLREPLLAMVPANPTPWPASPRSAWRRAGARALRLFRPARRHWPV
ncbi:hypothetical protein LNQ03_01060 [Klebsiella pneumoniae subsp. pneumoniae]|nr:hypothetical protein [Klebsiella pneumoniae subsp. pneumoniae]